MTNKTFINFEFRDVLVERQDYTLFRAQDLIEQRLVILKSLNAEYPSLEEISSFKSEFEIFKNLSIREIIKPLDLKKNKTSFLIVYENCEGESFAHYLNKTNFSPTNFVGMALNLAKIINDLHGKHILLKDFSPQSFLINQDHIKLIDLDHASHSEGVYGSHVELEPTLMGYVSPELTGRMNRRVDLRSDVYTLGVIFYEMMTGVLPFRSKDLIELIHSHLVLKPKEPLAHNDKIPLVLSSIVMKCLEKGPEERYQSVQGLINDLEICLDHLTSQNLSQAEKEAFEKSFRPGARDVHEIFRIPEYLYGREREQILLEEAFKSVCSGQTEWVLIAGEAGGGKTSLVKEFYRTILKENGLAVMGKFELLQHHVPFSGLIQALRKLVQNVLTEKQDILDRYKDQLLEAFQVNGQILVDYLPELELIIGKQAPAPKLSGEESRSRFLRMIIQFFQVFAQKEHPLVVLLDDLQWADSASLNCIKDLLALSKVHYLLIIGTYRNQEVNPSHPLSYVIKDTIKEGGKVTSIEISSLSPENLTKLTADTLHMTSFVAKPLAEIIYKKTEGNPFFVKELLKKLYEMNLIYFDNTAKIWWYNIEGVKSLAISDNVLDLMLDKIKLYPIKVQESLSMAASIGPRFSLNLLSEVTKISLIELVDLMQPLIKQSLIVPELLTVNLDDLLKEDPYLVAESLKNLNLHFQFIHDKVHQASDSLVQEQVKLEQHYLIGLILKNRLLNDQESDELLFETVSQLNYSRSIIHDLNERRELADLNLKACLKAKNAAAYSLAYELITVARELLPDNSWKNDYQLTYSIYIESAEIAYIYKKFEDIDALSKEIIQHAETNVDKGKLFIIEMYHYNFNSEYDRANDIGIECAKLFNIHIPKNPSKGRLFWEFAKLKLLIGKKSFEDLEAMPVIKDSETLFLLSFYIAMFNSAFLVNRKIMVYLVIQAMKIIVNKGNSEYSSFVYGTYGMIHQTLFKDYKTGFKYIDLAIHLGEKSNDHNACCRAYFIMALLNNHWIHPIRSTTYYLDKSYSHGLDSGELFFLSYIPPFYGFANGTYYTSLQEADKQIKAYSGLLFSARNTQAIFSYRVRTQYIKQLSNPDFKGLNLSDYDFNDEEYFNEVKNNSQFKTAYQAYVTFKGSILNLFGFYRQGVELFEESAAAREAAENFVIERDSLFYYLLNVSDYAETLKNGENKQQTNKIKNSLKRIKLWVENCPENNLHRLTLIEADLAKHEGNTQKALDLYSEAVKLALDQEFISEAAIGYERIGRLYLKMGNSVLAKAFMQEAHYTYYRWGAIAKVAQLEELYPQFFEQNLNGKNLKDRSIKSLINNTDEAFDISVVLEASTLLTRETSLDKLLKEILRMMTVEAGATRAIFILEQDDKWVIQGEKKTESGEANVLLSLPLESQEENLCLPMINYVIRTSKKIILNRVGGVDQFADDRYLKNHGVKAALCLPIIYQGKLAAILYSENKVADEVFTEDKIRVLEMLSSQIAASVQNARLYGKLADYNHNLEDKVIERTAELHRKNVDLKNTLTELNNTQNYLIETEKLAALGQLIAGIAHEVNTPLGAVKASSQNATESIKTVLATLPSLLKLLDEKKLAIFLKILEKPLSDQISMSSREERQMKRTMVEQLDLEGIEESYDVADKLVDMGHGPDILPLLIPLKNDLLPLLEFAWNFTSILKNNENIQMAVSRASKIIFALKSYIHQDRSEELSPSDLILGLESVLTLYHHQIKHDVILEKRFDKIPLVKVRLHEINQVWTNLIHNALHAMKNKGTLEINVFQENNDVVVQIIDSGSGIPDHVKPHLFSPFFTTKSAGEGSGMGLSISKKIIEAHGGKIGFDCIDNRTMFYVKLPINN